MVNVLARKGVPSLPVGSVGFIVLSMFFFLANVYHPKGVCTAIVTALLSLWVMVNLHGSLCEVKKCKENVPCTVFCKVHSLPLFFLLLFADKSTEKNRVVLLWTLGKVLCAPLQKCVRTTAQRTLKVKKKKKKQCIHSILQCEINILNDTPSYCHFLLRCDRTSVDELL